MGTLNILYQSDDAYASYLGISLSSLLISNKSCEEINIYILDIGISETNKLKIQKTCGYYHRNCELIDCKDIEDYLQNKGIPQYRDSYATYLKLYVRERLPKGLDKLLYIDCDTVITGDLSPLFERDLRDCPLGMVPDALAYQYKRKLGFEKDENYFNAGVILFQFDVWEEYGWDKRLDDYLHSHEMATLNKHDQDIVNIVFRGSIAEIPVRYNMQSIYYASDLKSVYRVYGNVLTVSKEQLQIEKKNKVILHFLIFNGESPWNEDNEHPFHGIFDECKSRSLWADLKPEKSHLNMLYRIEKYLYQKLPGFSFLLLFRAVHDFFHLI